MATNWQWKILPFILSFVPFQKLVRKSRKEIIFSITLHGFFDMLSEFYLFKTDSMPSSCLKSWGTRDWCLWVIQSTGTNGSLSCAWWRPQYQMTGSRYASTMAHSSPSRHWYASLHKSAGYKNQQFYLGSLFEHIIIFRNTMQQLISTGHHYWWSLTATTPLSTGWNTGS